MVVDRLLFGMVMLSIQLPLCVADATSDWLSAPKPTFPAGALKAGSEGSVKLQVVLTQDGHVNQTTVLQSSGSSALDTAARQAVSKWMLKRSAIKPTDLTTGRPTIVEFKQEALIAAVYPDRTAYFKTWKNIGIWMFAPFPSYPTNARQYYHTGKVSLGVTIGRDGQVSDVQILQSSGHHDLDQSALKAVRVWRAHKQFSGKKFVVPIDFKIGGKHYQS
jgi:TonB family protein